MKKILLCALFLLSKSLFAAPYQLKGSFFYKAGEKTPVSFNLRWVEQNGRAIGFYSDNRFTERSAMTGVVTDHGRTFEIVLARADRGVKSFSFLTSSAEAEAIGKNMPIQMVTRDDQGNPLSAAKFEAKLTEIKPQETAQAEEAPPCTEGFGQLEGVCGLYGGMVSEETDTNKMCELDTPQNLRLEVDNQANVILHTSAPGDRNGVNDHLIGRIPSDTESKSVDLMSRHCKPLSGTRFPGGNCKRLNLMGRFNSRNGTEHFIGTYSIIDEKTDRSCRYSMSMDLVNRI